MRKIGMGLFTCLAGIVLATPIARADTVLEQAAEHRFQLDFHVSDAGLQKMLPKGWAPVIATQGPAKDANIRLIFIDRMTIVGADGKPVGKGSNRMVYLAVPVKQTTGTLAGQMIIAGISEDPAATPGPFGSYRPASAAKMARSESASNGVVTVDEDWDFTAANGGRMQLHVKYERSPATKGGGEVKFFDPRDPAKYQTFKTEQAIDITRNVTTNPPDHVKEFSYKVSGGGLEVLFNGSEKVLSWDSFPWYNRTVSTP